MKRTDNYNLPQIELTDSYDVNVWNEGWVRTDDELKRIDSSLETLTTQIGSINTLLDTINGEVI